MQASELGLRVSVATLDRVVFQHPEDGTPMLALERKATLMADTQSAYVRAQPFGGAIQLRNSDALRDLIGHFQFDSERSRAMQDFRILIRQADWAAVKQFCLQHLQNADESILESDPSRELVEEFAECLHVDLEPHQYVYRPVGFVVENNPTPTGNIYGQALPTVRIYHIFDVNLVDDVLALAMMAASERHSDAALRTLVMNDARNGGRGRANTVLTMPLKRMLGFYRETAPLKRYATAFVDGHQLDISVLALFNEVEVPQFERLQ